MLHRQILSTGIKKEFWLGWMYAIVTITNLRRLRKNALFVIQGNTETSVEMRLEALERIHKDLALCMSQLQFEKFLVTQNGVEKVS